MDIEQQPGAAVGAGDEHITIRPSVLYVGTPVALVTTLNADGTTNISPMSSAWALADRVVLGMTSTSQGRRTRAGRGSW